MKTSIKYGLHLTFLSVAEIIILFTSKEHFVVYSSGVFMILTFATYLLRLIYIDFQINKYLKNNRPDIYAKLSTQFLGLKFSPRSALNFKFVIESLDDSSHRYYKEYLTLKKYAAYSLILFGLFSLIIVFLARPI